MDDSPCDAIVLAAAGLNRLGLTDHISEACSQMPQMTFPPRGRARSPFNAACQDDSLDFPGAADGRCKPRMLLTAAERTFLHALSGVVVPCRSALTLMSKTVQTDLCVGV